MSDVHIPLSVTAGPIAHITVGSSDPAIVAGGSTNFFAEGFDSFSNSLGYVDAAFTISPSAGGSIDDSFISATKVGTWLVTASYPGVNNALGTLTVTAGSIDHISVILPTTNVAGSCLTLSADGFDSFDNFIGPVLASFNISPDAGSIINEDSVSTTKAGSWTVTASFPGVNDATATLLTLAGSLDHINLSSFTTSIVAGGSAHFSGEGFDFFGNDLGPVSATLSISSGSDGSISGDSVSATKAGSWTVTASFPGMNDVTMPLSVVAGPLDHMTLTSSTSSIVAGDSQTFSAEGFDAFGNDLGPVDAILSVPSGSGGSVNGDSISATKAGSWPVTASLAGVKDATGTLSVTPGALDHISADSSSDGIVAGGSATVSAEGFDAFNNSLGPVTASLSLPSDAGGSVSGTTVSATKAGTWPVTASSGKVSATVPLKVNPGLAVGFSVSSQAPKSKDGSITTTVTAKDAYGNTVTNYNGNLKLSLTTQT